MGSGGDVPLSSTPEAAYSANMVWIMIGTLGLLALLCYDIHLSRKRKALWVPATRLLWTSLTVTLLQNVNHSYFAISDEKPLEDEDVRKLAQDIARQQVLMISSKVLVCVFVAYVIPGFSRERGWRLFSEVLAICISIANLVTRGAYEIFILIVRNKLQSTTTQQGSDKSIPTVSFIVSDVIIIVCSLLLVACLICSSLATISIAAMADLRTPLLFQPFHEDKGDLLNQPQLSWPIRKHKLLKFCVVVRTWQPHYVIARSTLTSLVFFIATCCFLVFLWQLQYCKYSRVNHHFEPGYVVYLPVQALFIVVAWGVTGWRLITAIAYQPRLLLFACKTPRFLFNTQQPSSRMAALRNLFSVEDYWLRTCKDIIENPEMMLEAKKKRWWAILITTIISKLCLHKGISAIFISVQCMVIWSSKVTWLFWEILLISPEWLATIITGAEEYEKFCAHPEKVLSLSNQNNKDEDGGQIERQVITANTEYKRSYIQLVSEPAKETTVNEISESSISPLLMTGETSDQKSKDEDEGQIERQGIIDNTEEHRCDIQSISEPAKGAAVNEISEFSNSVLFMTGETPNGILLVNRGLISMLDSKFNQERQKGMTSTLKKLLNKWVWKRNEYGDQKILDIAQKYSGNTVEGFDLGCGSLKMSVVSLLRVMVEVSECYKKEDQDVSQWISACREAWPIMDYLETTPPTKQANVIMRHADALLKELCQNPPMWLNHELNERHSIDTWVEIKRMLERLKAPQASESMLKSSCTKSGFDTRRWKREMAEANMTRICDLLLSELSAPDCISNLLERLNTAMAIVISVAVKRTHQAFREKLEWLDMLPFPDEEVLWEICSAIAFADGVCTDAPVEA